MPPATPAPPPTFSWTSDRTLRVSLGNDTSRATHDRVRAAFTALRRANLPGVRDLTPAYATLLVTFDPATLDPTRAQAGVAEVLRDLDAAPPAEEGRLIMLPVCYQGVYAPDTQEVSKLCNLDPGEVAALHSGAEYVVHFIGFSPGFPYLGGLPRQLVTPRLERPRAGVPAGSVAIAGDQTGIYPTQSPGGWRVIGRTPRLLFDPRRQEPSLLRMGDRIRFIPIGSGNFEQLARSQTDNPDRSA